MKFALIALLLAAAPLLTLAQKNYVFADIGVPAGFSITGDHQLTKRFSAGVGIQGYRFQPTITNRTKLVPALFADIRINSIMRKRHFFFYFLDLGMNFYKANDDHEYYRALFDFVPNYDGFYTGLGFGYFHRITAKGGLYVSLKSLGNIYNLREFDYATNQQRTATIYDGTLALSIGFRFQIGKTSKAQSVPGKSIE